MVTGERFNSISHLVGVFLAVAGAAVLITQASLQGDAWRIVAFSVYGTMLIALYGASTLYHALRGRAKAVFQKLDHCSIYLLIAGSVVRARRSSARMRAESSFGAKGLVR